MVVTFASLMLCIKQLYTTRQSSSCAFWPMTVIWMCPRVCCSPNNNCCMLSRCCSTSSHCAHKALDHIPGRQTVYNIMWFAVQGKWKKKNDLSSGLMSAKNSTYVEDHPTDISTFTQSSAPIQGSFCDGQSCHLTAFSASICILTKNSKRGWKFRCSKPGLLVLEYSAAVVCWEETADHDVPVHIPHFVRVHFVVCEKYCGNGI